MKITKSTVEKIRITEVKNCDPIEVIIEDFGDGQGQIFINVSCDCWSKFWGSMGCGIKEFFISCDKYYLAKKLIPYDRMLEDDLEGTIENIKEHIIEWRREGSYTKERARELWDSLELCGDIYEIRESEIGSIDDWYEFIQRKPTSECKSLRDIIIPAIKKALNHDCANA